MGENKDADQLRGNREADQRLCFRYTDSTFPPLLIHKFKILGFFCDCTGRFVSDLVGNPNCWFSHAQAHIAYKAYTRQPIKLRGLINEIWGSLQYQSSINL